MALTDTYTSVYIEGRWSWFLDHKPYSNVAQQTILLYRVKERYTHLRGHQDQEYVIKCQDTAKIRTASSPFGQG